MGTNFYIHTRSKPLAEKIGDYGLTDTPDFGYEIHIAKTSAGWLPLFQAHHGIRSVQDLKSIAEKEGVAIYDEYDKKYTWDEFVERVLTFNGGVKGVVKPEKLPAESELSRLRDPNMPDHTPVSHFEYGNGKYAHEYFTDPEGYEFTDHEFA